jgi:hypothetical protein
VASLLSVYAPTLLERVIPLSADSVVDDEDADPDQDGVDFPNRRGEQTGAGIDKDVGSGEA